MDMSMVPYWSDRRSTVDSKYNDQGGSCYKAEEMLKAECCLMWLADENFNERDNDRSLDLKRKVYLAVVSRTNLDLPSFTQIKKDEQVQGHMEEVLWIGNWKLVVYVEK